MSPRPSNRKALLEGALTCLQERGYADTRARDITKASGANLASIGYHFGSTEALLGEALAEGFGRWMLELALRLEPAASDPPALRIRYVASNIRSSFDTHRGLALAFLEAVARAPRSEPLRERLAAGQGAARTGVAALLGLGDDDVGRHTAALIVATFDGLLIQTLVDPDGAPTDKELEAAVVRLGDLVTSLRTELARER